MADTVLTLVRHGETEWNLSGKQQGHRDSPLTERGIAQAESLALALEEARFSSIYSSDLGRARSTAHVIAKRLGMKITFEKCLRERDLGILQGLTVGEFRTKYPGEYARFHSRDPDYVLPGGESVRQRYDRIISCLCGIAEKHRGGSLLVVAHGGVLDSTLRRIFGFSLAKRRCFSLLNSSINVVCVNGDEWRLVTWGSVAHLGGVDALDDT
jgi:probable phosphoglycerate mutase